MASRLSLTDIQRMPLGNLLESLLALLAVPLVILLIVL